MESSLNHRAEPNLVAPASPTTKPQDAAIMAVCAIRYTIGRRSYIVADGWRWARAWAAKSDYVREMVLRDLFDAASQCDRSRAEGSSGGALGEPSDETGWRTIMAEINAMSEQPSFPGRAEMAPAPALSAHSDRDAESMAICAIRYTLEHRTVVARYGWRWARDWAPRSTLLRDVIRNDIRSAAERCDRVREFGSKASSLGEREEEDGWRALLADLDAMAEGRPATDTRNA